ncbi:Inner membrane protein ykgB [Candidatus Ornithobacterium hominis]|uniref:Inner membrane protein ykgB n=1 Tax=Candidatus Ornithobacterium hominis TaxID=2497989 RepID=A0A383TV94_9FLAO|nr:DUF417 family protein [Candidatus Ornithobacterium hominis]MCT7904804.1 YkgB family protein [Candidatus Ornithobacterium hominis]MCT7905218.1 YkgB family protein [Candidatus Ornithobacterium hominis]SZD71572.1 Inner membrane protein ykgB [Candidatus Ornithobacterium hominis]
MKAADKKQQDIGMIVMILGTALILLWIGVFKFTPTEAEAIKPLMQNQPLLSWMYSILGVQGVSNFIGIVEIVTAILLILGLNFKLLLKYAGALLILTFTITISFIFTTPGVWKSVDGVPVTDFFILKDLIPLGLGIKLLNDHKKL